MILKTPHGTPVSVFFLTSEMHRLLVRQSIPLKDAFKLSSYHQQLTFNEIANILKFQYVVAQQMGVPLIDPKHLFGEGHNGGMVEVSFNGLDGKTLSDKYKECNSFNSLAAGANVLIVLFNDSGDAHVSGFDRLEATTFSDALLETLQAKVGYVQVHFGKVVKPNLGEFTMAEVYKLVSIENP